MKSDVTTWREELVSAGVSLDDIVAVAPDESVLDVEFDAGWGGTHGPCVLIWTEDLVYFPVVYDGSEWLDSAPRNPTTEPQTHVGG